MEITSRLKGFKHTFTVCHVSQKTEFKLSVICNDELFSRFWDEGVTNFVAIFFQSRLVLEVRTTGSKTACLSEDVD
jgi:hypothetical protein